jgi:hypothetical protein
MSISSAFVRRLFRDAMIYEIFTSTELIVTLAYISLNYQRPEGQKGCSLVVWTSGLWMFIWEKVKGARGTGARKEMATHRGVAKVKYQILPG